MATFDPVTAVGAVVREVAAREVGGKPARVVVAARTYDTTAQDLWDALTNPERIPRWFLPITGDLKLGGHYQLKGNAGGEITACEPPRRLAVTWAAGGGDPSWVTVTLDAEAPERTRLTLEHTAHVDDGLWDQFGPGAVGVGWDHTIHSLARHLAGDVTLDPAWETSDDGKAFSRASSAAWGEAAIAAGADPEAARASAARTTGFYTGEG